jgi:MFS family permease
MLTPSSQVPPRTPLRTVFASFREPRIATSMWIVVLVGLMFGTLDVLGPLRLDELGAGAVTIGATFVAAGALEATMSPFFGRFSDRHGRLLPCLIGLAAAGVAMLLLPWPESIVVFALVVLVTGPSIGALWTPSMALLSDGAEDFGLDQGYAVALINLAWSSGQTVGSAGGARLGETYGDALPYLTLAVFCALTFAALARPRVSAALAES